MNQIRRLEFSYQAIDPELMADVKKSWIAWEEQRKEFKIKNTSYSLQPSSLSMESPLLHEIQAMEKSANVFEVTTLKNPIQKLYLNIYRWLTPKTVRTRTLEFHVRCMNLARHVVFQEEYIRHLEEKIQVLSSSSSKVDKI